MFFIKLLLLIFVVVASLCIAYKESENGHRCLKPLESERYFHICLCFKEGILVYFIKRFFLVNLYHIKFAISFFCKSDNVCNKEKVVKYYLKVLDTGLFC